MTQTPPAIAAWALAAVAARKGVLDGASPRTIKLLASAAMPSAAMVPTSQLHLVSRGLKPTTIHPILYALRFFYRTTLGRSGVTEQISPPRRPDPLPTS